jgi:2-polyprenyl-3-methyl-5-hydroxy-6-metoxy-1,4-benzoquinol methylase
MGRATDEPEPGGAEWWERRYGRGEAFAHFGVYELLPELVGGLEPGTALELGAGDGRNAGWLARSGWRVTAADFAPSAIEQGRAQAAAQGVEIEWVHADVRDWRPAGTFDLVVAVYVHPDPPGRRAMLRAAVGAVAEGGHLLVAGRERADLGRVGGGPSDAERRFTTAMLREELAGIELLRCDTHVREVETGGGIERRSDAVAWGRRGP